MIRWVLPALWLVVALGSAAGLGVGHALGWREHTAFLSGNAMPVEAAQQGALYVALWLQAVVIVPVFGGAAVLGGAAEIIAWWRRER